MSPQQVNHRSSKRGVEQIDVTKCGSFIVRIDTLEWVDLCVVVRWCLAPDSQKVCFHTEHLALRVRRVEIGKYLRWEKRCRFGIQSMQRKTAPQLPALRSPYHQVLKSITTRWKWLVMKSIFWHTITWLYFCVRLVDRHQSHYAHFPLKTRFTIPQIVTLAKVVILDTF